MKATTLTPNRLERISPPNSVEAERAVLGSILRNARCLPDVLAHVSRPTDFYHDAHQRIFSGILALSGRNKPVDAHILLAWLNANGHGKDCGGEAYLGRLFAECQTSSHAEHYAKIVKEKSLRRELLNSCIRIMEDCYDQSGDASEVIDRAERDIRSIAVTGAAGDAVLIREPMSAAIRQHEAMAAGNTEAGTPWGFTDLDSITGGMHPGELTILAARPSLGKTALALAFARSVTITHKRPAYFASLEQSAQELASRLLAMHCILDTHRWRTGKMTPQEYQSLSEHMGDIAEAPLYVGDSQYGLMQVCASVRRTHGKTPLGLVLVDYIQLVEVEGRRSQQRYEVVGEISRRLKALAKELKVPVVALAQLSRACEERPDGEPTLADLRESGNLEADADNVFLLYRPKSSDQETGKVVLKIAKQRSGPVGFVPLMFSKNNVRFYDFAREPGYARF